MKASKGVVDTTFEFIFFRDEVVFGPLGEEPQMY